VFWTGSSILPHLHHSFRPCPRDHHHHGNDPLPVPAESLSITNRLLAVFDRRSETDAAVGALAAAGIDAGEITVLDGDAGLGRLRSRNRPGSPWARTLRLLSFMAVDQAVDLAWYEAALADGRSVVVVHTPDAGRRAAAVEALRRAGGHFMNHYGRFATQDIAGWRGAPPPVPWTHRR
jgi:hypothetical protein